MTWGANSFKRFISAICVLGSLGLGAVLLGNGDGFGFFSLVAVIPFSRAYLHYEEEADVIDRIERNREATHMAARERAQHPMPYQPTYNSERGEEYPPDPVDDWDALVRARQRILAAEYEKFLARQKAAEEEEKKKKEEAETIWHAESIEEPSEPVWVEEADPDTWETTGESGLSGTSGTSGESQGQVHAEASAPSQEEVVNAIMAMASVTAASS